MARLLVVLGAVAAGAGALAPAGCTSVRDDEGLAILDVSAQSQVSGFATFCFSVPARPQVRTHELPASASRRLKFGYYLPGPGGRVNVRVQAVAASGQVVGEGLAEVDIVLGHVSTTVALAVGTDGITPFQCGAVDGAAADARADADPAADGPADATRDERPDAPTSDAAVDGGADGPRDAAADAAADAQTDAAADAPTSDAAADGRPDAAADAPTSDAATDARPDAAADAAADAPPADAAADAPVADAAVDQTPPCTACTPGTTRAESEVCGPCGTGHRSRTATCSATCTWTGTWSACNDPGTAANGCSYVDWCTRKAAPECVQVGCSTADALAECREEAKSVCGSGSPSPTITNCN